MIHAENVNLFLLTFILTESISPPLTANHECVFCYSAGSHSSGAHGGGWGVLARMEGNRRCTSKSGEVIPSEQK
jgi:hypothetical protein